MTGSRQGFGIPVLDQLLGGGLLPGTHDRAGRGDGGGQDPVRPALGRHRARAPRGVAGVICDLTSRGDAQNHAGYARDQFGWEIVEYPVRGPARPRRRLGLRRGRWATTFTPSRGPAGASPAATSNPTTGTPGSRTWRGSCADRSPSSTSISSGARAGSSSTGSSRPSGSATRSSSSSSNTSTTRSSARRTNGPRASSSASSSAPTPRRSTRTATTTRRSAACTSTRPRTSCSTT